MNIQNVYILEDRGILYINGADTKEFLQNMISNDINKVNENSSCFASLLSPQGKFLFAFIIAKHKSGYFIDCEKSQIEALLNTFTISFSYWTNKFPVEEPAKSLIPQHPSKSFNSANSVALSGVAPK